MNEPCPPRLHAVLASDSPLAVIFRRGPSKAVATFLWDRKDDTFALGQWLKGRIYERRSDLSADGKYLIYFAMNGKWSSEAKGAWTTVSRAPWLKAISLHPKGDCWEGGGLFLSKNTYWLNDQHASAGDTLHVSAEVRHDASFVPVGGYGGKVDGLYFNSEDTGVYYRRLMRDGWKIIEGHNGNKSKSVIIFEKHVKGHWFLKKRAHEGGSKKGKGCYWDSHLVVKWLAF